MDLVTCHSQIYALSIRFDPKSKPELFRTLILKAGNNYLSFDPLMKKVKLIFQKCLA